MKIIHTSGKRKQAIAKATLKKGNGIVRFNNQLLETLQPEFARLRLQEPILLAGELAEKVNISVSVIGGGSSSQIDAGRLAIGRALVQHKKQLEEVFLDYDRHLLVADVRRKESSKPNSQGQARAKRQKSYR